MFCQFDHRRSRFELPGPAMQPRKIRLAVLSAPYFKPSELCLYMGLLDRAPPNPMIIMLPTLAEHLAIFHHPYQATPVRNTLHTCCHTLCLGPRTPHIPPKGINILVAGKQYENRFGSAAAPEFRICTRPNMMNLQFCCCFLTLLHHGLINQESLGERRSLNSYKRKSKSPRPTSLADDQQTDVEAEMPTLPYNSPDEANDDPKPDDQSNDPGMSSGVRIGIT